MAKKFVVDDAPEAPAVEDKKVRILVRVARMLKVRRESPSTETSQYDESILDYKYFWRKLSADDKEAVRKAAHKMVDLTPEDITEALTTLES